MIEDAESAHGFVAACSAARKLLGLLKKKETSESDLEEIDYNAMRLGPLIIDSQKGLPEDKRENVNIPKLHSCLHYRYDIMCCSKELPPTPLLTLIYFQLLYYALWDCFKL